MMDHHIRFIEKLRYEDNHFVRLYFLYVNRYDFVDQPFVYYYRNLCSTVNQKNQEYHFDRLEVERIKLEDYTQRGLMEPYRNGIEIDFLQTFYINTLALCFNSFDQPPVHRIKALRRELKERFPQFKRNPYYHSAISRMDRAKVLLSEISPRLLSVPYYLKNRRTAKQQEEHADE